MFCGRVELLELLSDLVTSSAFFLLEMICQYRESSSAQKNYSLLTRGDPFGDHPSKGHPLGDHPQVEILQAGLAWEDSNSSWDIQGVSLPLEYTRLIVEVM